MKIDALVLYRVLNKYVRNNNSELQSQTGCLMHWKSPLFSSFWYASSVNAMRRWILINLLFDTLPEWRQTTQTVWVCLLVTTAVGILSLITTGKIRASFAGPDFNLAQEITSTIRTGSGRRSCVAFSDRTWAVWHCLVSLWLIFQGITDSHISPLRWSHLVKVTMTFLPCVMALMFIRGRHFWLWNIFSSQTGQSQPREQLFVLSVTFSERIRMRAYSWPSSWVPECHDDTGCFHESARGGAQRGIWRVQHHPYLVHKGL